MLKRKINHKYRFSVWLSFQCHIYKYTIKYSRKQNLYIYIFFQLKYIIQVVLVSYDV